MREEKLSSMSLTAGLVEVECLRFAKNRQIGGENPFLEACPWMLSTPRLGDGCALLAGART